MNKTRLLYLAYEHNLGDQRGRRRVFNEMLDSGRLDALGIYPYQLRSVEVGWQAMLDEVHEIAAELQPTVVYWQHLVRGDVDELSISKLRSLSSNPVICNETGDAFGNYWKKPFPKGFVEFSKLADITFMCGLGRMETFLKKKGVDRIELLPNFCDPQDIPVLNPENYSPVYDVVMIANNVRTRRPFASMPGQKERVALVKQLSKTFGKRFALFGKGWDGLDCAQGPIDFFKQAEVYHNARVGIGCANFLDIDYYDSNRLYIAIATGTPYVSRYVPKIDKLLEDGEHCFFYKSNDEAIQTVKKIVDMDDSKRVAMGLRAAEYVRTNHSVDSRMEQLLSVVENL